MTAEERLDRAISWGNALLSASRGTYWVMACAVALCDFPEFWPLLATAGYMIALLATLKLIVGLRISYLKRKVRV